LGDGLNNAGIADHFRPQTIVLNQPDQPVREGVTARKQTGCVEGRGESSRRVERTRMSGKSVSDRPLVGVDVNQQLAQVGPFSGVVGPPVHQESTASAARMPTMIKHTSPAACFQSICRNSRWDITFATAR
jgi:hypothetical protein